MSFVITLSVIIALEVIMMFIIRNLRKRFRWLITPLDEYPKLDEKGLKKFIEQKNRELEQGIRAPSYQKKCTSWLQKILTWQNKIQEQLFQQVFWNSRHKMLATQQTNCAR